jgi:charged multivesicular body protein 6
MGGLCGGTKINNKEKEKGKKVSELPAEEKALMDCKQTRDKIKKELKNLDHKKLMNRETAKKELKSGNKEKAKIYLNRSKLIEKRAEVYSGQLTMIEEQITTIQNLQMQKDAIKVLQQGNEILKKMNEEVNINKWQEVKDNLESLKEDQDEITTLIKGYGIDQNKFDEEIDEELNKMIEASAAAVIENPNSELNLPSIKKKEIKVNENSAKEKNEKVEKNEEILA